MKNKFTARLCIFMCLVLIVSMFAACNIKDKSGDASLTTLAPDDSWRPGNDGTYEPVILSKVELAELVSEALGEDAKDFNGDLNSLTPEQIQKVEDLAEDKGLIIDKDDSGNTVIKKEEVPTTKLSQQEINEILTQASVKDPSNISKEELEEISKIADDNGMSVVTKPNGGGIEIVKPVPTTTQKATSATTKNNNATTQAPAVKTTTKPVKTTTAKYVPPTHGTVAPMGTTAAPVPIAGSDWVATYGGSSNDIYTDNTMTSDGGVVSVGATFSQEFKGNNKGSIAAIITKHNAKGKLVWKNAFSGDNNVAFENVTVLNDGSVIVVGYTSATNFVSDAEYKCKGTIEGIIIKFNAKGEKLWTKVIGGSGDDFVYSVASTPDGGFVIGGKSTSVDGDMKDLGTQKIKAYIFKCDANGNIKWRNALSGSKHSSVESMAVTSSGEIYAAVACISGDGEFAAIEGTKNARRCTVALKLNASGKILWSKAFYETGVTDLYSVALADDGGAVFAGHYSSSAEGNKYTFKNIYNGGTPGTYDGVMIKVDAAGNQGWMLPLIGFESDFIMDIAKVSGGYAVTGYTASTNRDFSISSKGNYDGFIYTITNSGKAQNIYSFGGSGADNTRAICSYGKAIYVAGTTNSGDVYFENCSPKGTENACVGFVCRFEFK